MSESSRNDSPTTHTVRQGDCFTSIAHAHGFFWETLWNAPENAGLRETRESPHVLEPGDEVVIPARRRRTESGASEQIHRFRRRGAQSRLRLVVRRSGTPRGDTPYRLVVDGEEREGRTGGDGSIDEPLPPNASRALLIVGEDELGEDVYDLRLGGMDPLDSVRGAQSRLRNLGYECPVHGDVDAATRAAIEDFQREYELEETGELDEITRRRIQEMQENES